MNNTNNKYVCENCKFSTNTKARWNSHIGTELHINGKRKQRTDYKEPINCTQCEYSSKNKTMLKTHILNNHKTKEERKIEFKYYCIYCEFGTFAVKSFDIHNKTDKHIHSCSLFKKINNE